MTTMVISLSDTALARDTDIYSIDSKNNAYMFMDNSGSMEFPVYENSINYARMHCSTSDDCADYTDSEHYYERNRIYLVTIPAGVSIQTVDGNTVSFTGDAGKLSIWPDNDGDDDHPAETATIDSGTLINSDSLTADGRLTVNGGVVTLDGENFPNGQAIKLNDYVEVYGGGQNNQGFIGMLKAPGYYFSGYSQVGENEAEHVEAASGDQDVVFFASGNWLNMVRYYDEIDEVEYDLSDKEEEWPEQLYNLVLPDAMGARTAEIFLPGAAYIQVHISSVSGTVTLNGTSASIGWNGEFTGDTVTVDAGSDGSVQIDKVRLVYSYSDDNTGRRGSWGDDTDSDQLYKLESRIEVAKGAMALIALEFTNINWGFATFGSDSTGADIKATVNFNPQENDDLNGNELLNHIFQVTADGGTPLGEALQDMFIDGYYQHNQSIDNHSCRKNFVIMMTDGFPSVDEDWQRIEDGTATVTFTDSDGDGWTQDPVQYTDPAADYYDDVGHWMYTHSWVQDVTTSGFTEVDDPANSYENIITHHISFGSRHPLLSDAAGESGGQYIAAFNKTQLISAFKSLAMMISEAVSFTAPVVSVDSANKIQSGDDLYMGLFQPREGLSWVGNVKKFKLGQGCDPTDDPCVTAADGVESGCCRPDLWMIYDAANDEAIEATGEFKENTAGFWGDDTDFNDNDSYGSADIMEDGVGEVLAERLADDFAKQLYWERDIYTYKGGALVAFNHANISAADLGVADNAARDKLINYVYGYTNDAGYDGDGNPYPVDTRNWPLGSIIHSKPVVLDYYDRDDASTVDQRYIVIGANDGMLHVFDDLTGIEVFAFIPQDLLPKLKFLPDNDLVDMVDGEITLYRKDGSPKYLIFGERRGGDRYWSLNVSDKDVDNWTVQWTYSNSEIGQTWAAVQISSVPWKFDTATQRTTYKDVIIFTGGYDSDEDNYPEPFNDLDGNGTPYNSSDSIDPSEWTGAPADYDIFNPGSDRVGRGIFVVDIDNPANVVHAGGTNGDQILPFSVTYGATDSTSGVSQTLLDMKYCFPATPSVVSLADISFIRNVPVYQGNKLAAIYAADIYANIYKVSYEAEIDADSSAFTWKVQKIFSANPGSLNLPGTFNTGDDPNVLEQGRKTFYSPTIAWGGTGSYFDANNYRFTDEDGTAATFNGTDRIATLYFGTGDREHPRYTIVRNRMYAIFDDSAVTAQYNNSSITVSTIPYSEDDLLNVSTSTVYDDTYVFDPTVDKQEIGLQSVYATAITDDPVTEDNRTGDTILEDGTEDDAKGWYIDLESQLPDDSHDGEKILSQPSLYYGIVYFTSYLPPLTDGTYDSCNPMGSGFTYAVDYLDGSAVFDINQSGTFHAVTDRSLLFEDVYGIPSGFNIITVDGEAGAISSMGDKAIGPGPDGGFQIITPGMGLELYYWREKN